MDSTLEMMQLKIDGNWTAQDFGEAFLALSDLYDFRLHLELLREEMNDSRYFFSELADYPLMRPFTKMPPSIREEMHYRMGMWYARRPPVDAAYLSRLPEILRSEQRLRVRRIRYSSPGISDMAGIGTVVGHITDFILKLIERYDTRRERKLKDERADLDNQRIRIEIARELASLCREAGYSESDHRVLTAFVDGKQEPLIRLISQGKITGIERHQFPEDEEA